MAFYRQVGEVPHKRHTQFRQPDGRLYSEELVGEEGFSSDSSLLYTVAFRRLSPMLVTGTCPTSRPCLTARFSRGTYSCTLSSSATTL